MSRHAKVKSEVAFGVPFLVRPRRFASPPYPSGCAKQLGPSSFAFFGSLRFAPTPDASIQRTVPVGLMRCQSVVHATQGRVVKTAYIVCRASRKRGRPGTATPASWKLREMARPCAAGPHVPRIGRVWVRDFDRAATSGAAVAQW